MDRKTLEMQILSTLRKKNFAHAVDLAFTYGYRTAATTSAGLEIWVATARKLELLFASTPALFEAVPSEVLDQMRLIAGLLHLLGEDQPIQVVRPGSETVPGTHIGSRWAPRMLLTHVDFLLSMETYQEHAKARPHLFLTVRHAGDELVCPACQELSRRRFRLEDAVELPYPLCTCERGCRCYLHPTV